MSFCSFLFVGLVRERCLLREVVVMSVRVQGKNLQAERSCRTLKGIAVERDPRPRCREFCNIRECDPRRSEFVCNFFQDRILPKTPHPPRLQPKQLRLMGIHEPESQRVMDVIEEFDPDQAIYPAEDFDLLV